MEDLRQSFIDRLSSKKQELIEEEELRKKDAEAAAKAETERKQREEEERKQRELEIQQKNMSSNKSGIFYTIRTNE